MTELDIPRPEETSPDLARLLAREEALNNRLRSIYDEQREAYAASMAQHPFDARKARAAALIEGLDYTPPASAQQKIVELAQERVDVDEAVRELHGRVVVERMKASRAIAMSFADHHRGIASEFFSALLATAKAHARMGEFHRALRRSGVEPGPLVDFGSTLFGSPLDRTSDAWITLRKAARDGFLKESDIPKEFA